MGTLVDAEARKGTYYVVTGHILQKTRNTGSVFILSTERDADIFDLVASSFPVVLWLNAKNYVGVEKVGLAFYYKFHKLPELDANNLIFNGERTAWIRVSDGYPLKVQLDKMVFTFSEVTPFPYTIDLPVEYQEILSRRASRERAPELLRE